MGLALWASTAHAGTIDVNNTTCKLVQAVNLANNNNLPSGLTADANIGSCTGASSGANTINLTANVTITLNVADTRDAAANGSSGLPPITSTITLNGNGSTLSRISTSGSPEFRLIQVGRGSGGTQYPGSLTINRLTVSGGSTPNPGGGIEVISGSTLALNQSTVSGNTSTSNDGGGIHCNGGGTTLQVTKSTVSGNTGRFGGGITAGFGCTATVADSTLSGNTASNRGGGYSADSAASTITGSTITGNASTHTNALLGGGGGVAVNSGYALTLQNTLVAGNSEAASKGADVYVAPAQTSPFPQPGGTLNANATNLFGHAGLTDTQAFSGFTPGASDLKATQEGLNKALTDILNTTLADNGGSTKTHALVAGSPAINAADPNFTDSTPTAGTSSRRDQRNYVLVSGDTRRDIGAYELNGVEPTPTVTSLAPTSGPVAGGTTVTITGTNLTAATAVKFGTTAATSFTVNSATSITATSPAGTGTVDVTVTTADGTSANNGTADDFTYQANADGVCATDVTASASAPSTGLCTSGTATAVSSTGGSWKWGCNGVGTGSSTAANACSSLFQTQTLSIGADPTSIAVNGTSLITASSTSGLTPELSRTTPTFCSLSGTTITGIAGGTCTVQATIAKSADSCGAGNGCYQAAEKQVDITVSKADQTISPIMLSANTLPVGGTATASTSSSSGLAVSFSGTTGICSVSSAAATAANYVQATAAADSATVTALGVGTCTITASQSGNTAYNAATSVTATIVISVSAPMAPTNLSARAGNKSATISFTAGSNGGASISNYEYSLDGGSWTPLTPAVSASPVTINGLSNGQTYLISLRAVNSSGFGEASSPVSVRPRAPSNGGGTPPPSPPSAAPAGISASGAANGQVTLGFTPPGGTVTNYEYSLDGGQTFLPFIPAVTSSPVTIKGLSDGVTYTIVLRAVNSDGTGPASLPVLVTPMMDTDLDGVGDATESPVPDADGTGTGDGNGDGVADGTQSSVTSLANPAGVYTTLVSSSGRTLKQVSSVATPADFPTDAGTVFSGVSFSVSGLAVGAAETLELYVPSSVGTVTGLRKKNLRTGSWDVIPATISTVGSKTRIVYSLIDGGDYDSDGATRGHRELREIWSSSFVFRNRISELSLSAEAPSVTRWRRTHT